MTRSCRAETLYASASCERSWSVSFAKASSVPASVSTTTTLARLAANSNSDIKKATVCSARSDLPVAVGTDCAARMCRATSSSMINVGRSPTSSAKRPVPGAER